MPEDDDEDDGRGSAKLHCNFDTSTRIASGEWLSLRRVFGQPALQNDVIRPPRIYLGTADGWRVAQPICGLSKLEN